MSEFYNKIVQQYLKHVLETETEQKRQFDEFVENHLKKIIEQHAIVGQVRILNHWNVNKYHFIDVVDKTLNGSNSEITINKFHIIPEFDLEDIPSAFCISWKHWTY